MCRNTNSLEAVKFYARELSHFSPFVSLLQGIPGPVGKPGPKGRHVIMNSFFISAVSHIRFQIRSHISLSSISSAGETAADTSVYVTVWETRQVAQMKRNILYLTTVHYLFPWTEFVLVYRVCCKCAKAAGRCFTTALRFPLLWWSVIPLDSAVVDTRSPAHGYSDTRAFVTTHSEPAADNKTLRMSPVTRLKVRRRSCIRFCSRLLPMCKSLFHINLCAVPRSSRLSSSPSRLLRQRLFGQSAMTTKFLWLCELAS